MSISEAATSARKRPRCFERGSGQGNLASISPLTTTNTNTPRINCTATSPYTANSHAKAKRLVPLKLSLSTILLSGIKKGLDRAQAERRYQRAVIGGLHCSVPAVGGPSSNGGGRDRIFRHFKLRLQTGVWVSGCCR